MKQIKLISAMLLIATMFLGFNACSDDDDNGKEQTSSIVGKWKVMEDKYSNDRLEFKSNGTFDYYHAEWKYSEVGKYKVESGKLYQMYSDEEDWIIYQIIELNSISLITEEFRENGTLSGYRESYQRIN